MYTHGRAARHAQVSRLVVVIHYETISLCYLGTICFCYVRFVISACSIMVSRIITYGAAAKFLLVTSSNGVMTKTDGAVTKPRASCECTHMVVLLGTRRYHG